MTTRQMAEELLKGVQGFDYYVSLGETWPATPLAGERLLESTTGRMFLYTGAAWISDPSTVEAGIVRLEGVLNEILVELKKHTAGWEMAVEDKLEPS